MSQILILRGDTKSGSSGLAMDSMAMETSGRLSGVKESTARNIHMFSGINMSSIGSSKDDMSDEKRQGNNSSRVCAAFLILPLKGLKN